MLTYQAHPQPRRVSFEASTLVADGEQEENVSIFSPPRTPKRPPGPSTSRLRNSTPSSSSPRSRSPAPLAPSLPFPSVASSTSDSTPIPLACAPYDPALKNDCSQSPSLEQPLTTPSLKPSPPRRRLSSQLRERMSGVRRRASLTRAQVGTTHQQSEDTIQEESSTVDDASKLDPKFSASGSSSSETTTSPENPATGSRTMNTVPAPTQCSSPGGIAGEAVNTPDVAQSPDDAYYWGDEDEATALRRYYALRAEAENTVSESKKMWLDTPLSFFVVQTFQPPKSPSTMQELLDYSVTHYGPLPSELRPRRTRSRKSSRPTPYPLSHIIKPKVRKQLRV